MTDAAIKETRAQRHERLADRVRTLPTDPGCYLMKDKAGVIFYVGKASSLRARVRSYFGGSDARQFVGWLDDILFDLDVMVVRNEKEALLLERTLVRQHQPRFNVKLRDDKNFIHLRLDTRPVDADAALRKRFVRVEVVRGPTAGGARMFGPYHSATMVRATLRVLNRHFQLRTCRDSVLENRARPCLQHQIGRCPAPCVFPVDDYAAHVQEAALFLSGRTDELEERLKQRMADAAAAEEFEVAARARDHLAALQSSLNDQAVADVDKRRDIDIVAANRTGNNLVIVRIPVRAGHMHGSIPHVFSNAVPEVSTAEFVTSYLTQLYVQDAEIPDEILLGVDVGNDAVLLEEALSEKRGKSVLVRVPQRGHGRRLLEIADKNADAVMTEHIRKKDTRDQGLQALQARLGMSRPAHVVECFDVSLFQGTDAVASQICFVDGAPEKSRYRRYTIRSVEGTNDFAMLHEALVRRFKRGRADGDLPDVIVVDGGKGQLSVAQAAAKDTQTTIGGDDGVYLCSIAKARSFSNDRPDTLKEERPHADPNDDLAMSPERLFVVGNKDPIVLRPHTAERFLLEQLRDEAHRFAITAHRGKRKRRTLRSVLDDIPGVGPKKRKLLLSHLGSVEDIAVMDIERIARVPTIGRVLALAIKAALGDDAIDAPAPDDAASPGGVAED